MDMEQWMSGIHGDAEGNGRTRGHMHSGGVDEECAPVGAGGTEEGEVTKVGRRRQVIGILVLQLGIMIHSLVIGLTGLESSVFCCDHMYMCVLCGIHMGFCSDKDWGRR